MRDRIAEVGKAWLNAPFGTFDAWEDPLRRVAELTGAKQTQFVGQSFQLEGEASVLFHCITDPAPNAAEDYFVAGADRAEVNWKAAMQSKPLELVHSEQYTELAAQRGSRDIFTQYLQDYRGFHGAHVTLIGEADALFTLALLNDRPTSAEQLALFSAITPYAHAAALMQRAMEAKGASISAESLETLGVAAFLLDRSRQVMAMTKLAEHFVRTSSLLTVRRDRLRASRSSTERELQAAISACLERETHMKLVLHQPLEPAPYPTLELFALPKREWSFGFEPRVMAIVRTPAKTGGEEQKQLLAQMFQFSEAESDVALHMANGLGRDEIARRRGSALSTVHDQIKSIYRKAGVRREGELVALLNRILRR